jgi:hypothetical protein
MLVGNGAEGKEIEVPYYLLPLKNVNTYQPKEVHVLFFATEDAQMTFFYY